MCGIVGILGKGAAAPRIVEALKRLEYRGYDSAGVATLEYGELRRVRAEGKLRNLEAKLADRPLEGDIGIGHTRWATHGKPTETNAHPHASDRLAVVHNGIIENFRVLREELIAKGYRFVTETDTEIAAFLVTDELDAGKTPGRGGACGAAAHARRLRAGVSVQGRGQSADRRAPGRAARGRAGRRRDVPRLRRAGARPVHRPRRLSRRRRLGDRHARRASSSATPATASVQRRFVRDPAGGLLAEKGNYRHFMAKEIHEQPEVIGHTIAHYVDMGAQRLQAVRLAVRSRRPDRRVSIVACGTAYMAGLIGKYWIERFARLPVEVDVASEYRYREPPVDKGGLTIFVSQSGETADTLASLRYAKENGARTVAVVNVPTSSIARLADAPAPTLAGPEIGVASTKAFTCQLVAMAVAGAGAGPARAAC